MSGPGIVRITGDQPLTCSAGHLHEFATVDRIARTTVVDAGHCILNDAGVRRPDPTVWIYAYPSGEW
jgi:hypothetical protein